MFRLEKSFSFEAGHVLPLHDGKCARPHGHSYTLTVILESDSLVQEGPQTGMVMDFSRLSEIIEPVIKNSLDHHWLNDTLGLEHPTAEAIAQWVYRFLKPQIPLLHSVCIQETASARVFYRE